MTDKSMISPAPNRRTIVKGVAWAVPAVTVAGISPAFASSPIPPNGLNGWVQLSRNCFRTDWFQIDGRGNYPNRGLWTFVPDPNAEISDATVVFYFDRNDLVFTNSSQPGWSNLDRVTTLDGQAPAPGFYAYRATYSGNWTYVSTLTRDGVTEPGGWVANSDPYWLSRTSGCGQIRGYARRSITVNGETVTFTRGPITL